MTIHFSNKINLKGATSNTEESKNEVLIIKDTEICHVGMNGNLFIFTEEELKSSFKSLERVPLIANVTDYVDDHNVSALNTVGWVYDPVFENSAVKATLEITHPEIIEKMKRKTTKGEREINFVSMGCNAEKLKCNICGEEIYYDSMICDNGHKVGQTYDGEKCGMVGVGIEFEHVALTNIPADKEAKVGKEVNVMYAKKIKANKENEDTLEKSASDEIKPSEDKLIEALKDKINVIESEIEEIREVISKDNEESKGDGMDLEEEKKLEKEESKRKAKKVKSEDEEEIEATEEEEKKKEIARKIRAKIIKNKLLTKKKVSSSRFSARSSKRISMKSKPDSSSLVAMYKKIAEKRFGELPTAVANSNSLALVRSYYKIKSKKAGNSVVRGNVIEARKNTSEYQIKAAMEDRTGEGYKKIFEIAKRNNR